MGSSRKLLPVTGLRQKDFMMSEHSHHLADCFDLFKLYPPEKHKELKEHFELLSKHIHLSRSSYGQRSDLNHESKQNIRPKT